MTAKRRKPSKRRRTASKWRVWTVRLAALGLFVGLTVGLMFYARSISPELAEDTSRYAAFEGGPEAAEERPIDVVRRQLVEYSGRSFPVALAQTGQWGQAYPGGIILLDSSVLTDEPDIMAFKYAHEWAHQLLGHVNPHRSTGPVPAENPGTVPSPLRSAWDSPGFSEQSQTSATQVEDEADTWAGAFLARYEYDLDAVAEYLRDVPYNPTDTTHSPGDRRAELVLSAVEQ